MGTVRHEGHGLRRGKGLGGKVNGLGLGVLGLRV